MKMDYKALWIDYSTENRRVRRDLIATYKLLTNKVIYFAITVSLYWNSRTWQNIIQETSWGVYKKHSWVPNDRITVRRKSSSLSPSSSLTVACLLTVFFTLKLRKCNFLRLTCNIELADDFWTRKCVRCVGRPTYKTVPDSVTIHSYRLQKSYNILLQITEQLQYTPTDCRKVRTLTKPYNYQINFRWVLLQNKRSVSLV